MGQEISHSQFTHHDFELFSEHLREETELLHRWISEGRFVDKPYQAGFEMEAWLLDEQLRPAAKNHDFLEKLSHPMAVPELARFNFELNGRHRTIASDVFSQMYKELRDSWHQCQVVANELGLDVAAIGILPTAELEDFTLTNMSGMQRYRALNDQILRMREGRALQFRFEGHEILDFSHPDVMLEAATTSFQIHLRMPLQKSVRLYNAGKIVSGPLLAACANSPYFLGRDLWAETRIAVFEQAVQVGWSDLTKRVSFGIRYAHESIMEVFDSNLARYPIMLPRVFDEPAESLSHLRLHNGTIWRWNRPLVGFDEDGTPHFRLEHRSVPSGPTLIDAISNAAFFYGLVVEIAQQDIPMEQLIPFEMARNNFYTCAQFGLNAEVMWIDNKRYSAKELLLEELLPMAANGLERLEVNSAEINHWLAIIGQRIESGQTGAVWQREWVYRHGNDMQRLTRAYLERQKQEEPVHQWSLGK
jgi:gamma-glutamyl:cysteine ligase YbdK (ATP-grasp superfamily)